MRWLAGAGLFVLVGCNQIFGLQATQAFDAAPDGVLDRPHVTLDWQVATTKATNDAPTSPLAPVAPMYVPISPAPKVRIAPLFADAAKTTLGTFVDPKGGYTASDGTIEIPSDYITQPWRLEYTLADGIAHEVQWQPVDKKGHVTVPAFGRLDRASVPPGAGYAITPTSPPISYGSLRVFTLGLWTEGNVETTKVGDPIDYSFASALSSSGVLGAPELAKGDRGLVLDFQIDSDNSCLASTGGASFDPTLSTLPLSPSAAWDTTKIPTNTGLIDPARLNVLGDLIDGLSDSSFTAIGALPSMSMPGLTSTQPTALLPTPVMVTLERCQRGTGGKGKMAKPEVLEGLPLAIHIQLVGNRKVLGANLTSGMETVVPFPATGTANPPTITFPAPFATHIVLGSSAGQQYALDPTPTPDQVPVASTSGVFTLQLTPEDSPDLRADYYDVVLHRIANQALTTERVYTVMTAGANAPVSIQIDGALLVPNTDYVFEIRAYHGHPDAPQGDLSTVEYAYGATVTFPRTFHVTAN